ncbi:MAG TPA: hypothetical protein VH165_04665 [Kofleriaceae bacterium]|nr:hypothetical protein [Kofleriaceae bacterium]
MSRSKTSNCTSSVRYACRLIALVGACSVLGFAGCHKKPAAVAELVEAAGPVERQVETTAWGPAPLGTQYFLGDAARTADSTASLVVGGPGGAKLVMQRHTVLRFGGVAGDNRISVELGAVDLSGTGSYALDVGEVKLADHGTVRITSKGNGRSSVELTVGAGQVAANGQTYELTVGSSLDVGATGAAALDAGVRDAAPPDAAADAAVAVAATDGEATIQINGKRAELLAPGSIAWRPLPEGAGTLARGSTVRLGAQTFATLVAAGTTLELAGGARVKLGDDLGVAIELGIAEAKATAPAAIGLPGGTVALAGSPRGPSQARIDSNPRDTKVTMMRGGSKLAGAPGAELGMSRGESALLTRTGAIRIIEAIPSYFDFRVVAGESLTIHDPRPPTSVQLQFDGKCAEGGIIEIDRDNRFRTAKVSSGRDFANVLIPGGSFAYRLRCTTNGTEAAAVASGRITALRDDGRRPLPKNQGVNDIDADGRNYRISYQSAIPNVAVHIKNPGTSHRLHLASAGKEQTFDSSASVITVPGAQLHEGTYTYWIDRDGLKQEKVSTLAIDFDQTAPQVYIESPINGQPWAGDIDVRGAVLPGWSAQVDAVAIPVDKQRRFAAKVGAPGGAALAIRLAHPQRGVHYYLRRQK